MRIPALAGVQIGNSQLCWAWVADDWQLAVGEGCSHRPIRGQLTWVWPRPRCIWVLPMPQFLSGVLAPRPQLALGQDQSHTRPCALFMCYGWQDNLVDALSNIQHTLTVTLTLTSTLTPTLTLCR